VSEVSFAGEDHGDAGGLGRRDRFTVLDRPAGLDHGTDAAASGNLYAIGIGEKSIARQHRPLGPVTSPVQR